MDKRRDLGPRRGLMRGMEQSLNPKRRRFLVFSGLAVLTATLATLATKFSTFENAFAPGAAPRASDTGYGGYRNSPYGGL